MPYFHSLNTLDLKRCQKGTKAIPTLSQNEPKTIAKQSQIHSKIIQNDSKVISKRPTPPQNDAKTIPKSNKMSPSGPGPEALAQAPRARGIGP